MKNRMKKSLKPGKLPLPAEEKRKAAQELDGQGVEKYIFDERRHVPGCRGLKAILDNDSVFYRNSFSGNHENKRGKGHDSQSAELNENDDHHLTEGAEKCGRILDNQARHTDRRGRGKKSIDKRHVA